MATTVTGRGDLATTAPQRRDWPERIGLALRALAGCGASSAASGLAGGIAAGEAAQTVEIRAASGGRLGWERPAYAASAGDVTFVVTNPPGLAHTFAVEGLGIKAQGKSFAGGTTTRSTLRGLAPGEYRIACILPGHREAGMVAMLTVR